MRFTNRAARRNTETTARAQKQTAKPPLAQAGGLGTKKNKRKWKCEDMEKIVSSNGRPAGGGSSG